jgi:hypothetical protein
MLGDRGLPQFPGRMDRGSVVTPDVEVRKCQECPFKRRRSRSWHAHLEGACGLTGVQLPWPDYEVPDWCPLRKTSVLVTLAAGV